MSSWMWESSPGAFTTMVGCAAATGYLSYRTLSAASSVVNGLESLSKGNADIFGSIYGPAIEGGAFALLTAASGVVYSSAKSWFETKFQQTVRVKSLDAINRFTPAEQQTKAVQTECNKLLQGRFSLQEFSRGFFSAVTALSGVGFSAYALSTASSGWPVAVVVSFVPLYMLHAVQHGRDKLKAMAATLEAQSRFGHLDWTSGATEQAIEIRVNKKTQEYTDFLREEKRQLDEKNRVPQTNQTRREAWLQPFNSLVLTGLSIHALSNAAYAYMTGTARANELGQYTMTIGALLAANTSFASLSTAISALIRELPIIRSVQTVLERTAGRTAPAQAVQQASLAAPEVNVSGPTYAYPPTNDKPTRHILENVTLRIGPGELVAIVGKSGCGKSTLAKLLAKVLEAPAGTITLDGKKLSDMSPDEAFGLLGFCQQKSVAVYSTTIRDNIRIGARGEISDAEILEHLEASGFAEDMRREKWTLDSVVGAWFENGIGLSGGQQTRLALSRVYATGARLVILDEPTANLDQERTDVILDKLFNQKDRTRIVIAHDFGIARNADRIVVIESGQVQDTGTHNELISRCPAYQRAFAAQATRLLGGFSDEEVAIVRRFANDPGEEQS